MDKDNHYKILQVPYNATEEEIRDSYRELARLLHPDVNQAPDASEKFSAIQEAYTILSNPLKRAEYDKEEGIRFINDPAFADFSQFSENIRKEKQNFDGVEDVYNPFTELFNRKPKRARAPTTKNLNWFKSKLLGKKIEEVAPNLDSLNDDGTKPSFSAKLRRISKKALLGERTFLFTITSEEAKRGTERKMVIKTEDGSTKSIIVPIPAGTTDGSILKIPTPYGAVKEATVKIRVEG
ncbi:MAG TPA: DnaJ domain-containing protein [Oligoflexia bacterium]|nr:DnaJ domain-containing protein [Oligoflexia bacterium]HMP48905.1 DnaJ domain-containing protein [Oligoflexia bacterium]